jgi:hypothetical protein
LDQDQVEKLGTLQIEFYQEHHFITMIKALQNPGGGGLHLVILTFVSYKVAQITLYQVQLACLCQIMVTEQGSLVNLLSRFDQKFTQLKLKEPETTRNGVSSDMTQHSASIRPIPRRIG